MYHYIFTTDRKRNQLSIMNISNLIKEILILYFSLFWGMMGYSQPYNTPCECAQRFTGGGTWDFTEPDLVDDGSNARAPNGVIYCSSAASTMSNIVPMACVYNADAFVIDVESAIATGSISTCLDPSTGLPGMTAVNPTEGEPIIWLNFDVRPFASDFEIQINDNNAADDIVWALYVSNLPTTGTPNVSGIGDQISGDCSNNQLTLVAACGVEGVDTWSNFPVPDFSQASNFYLALWDRNHDGDLDVNNFKTRFGCGSGNTCALIVDIHEPIVDTNNSTWSINLEVTGVDAEYIAYDANALNSDTTCLSLTDNNVNTVDILTLTYPTYVTNYNISVSAVGPGPLPSGCAAALNYPECITTLTGSVPCFEDHLVLPGVAPDHHLLPGDYQAGISITSKGIVVTINSVNFRAGSHIILNNGFQVESNAVFLANIEDCPSPVPTVKER